jgi:hypothetical protein
MVTDQFPSRPPVEPYAFRLIAQLASILNKVVAFAIRIYLFKDHRFVAKHASHQT